MKNLLQQITPHLNRIHPYPYWVFLIFLYASILTFALCGMVLWLSLTHAPAVLGEMLFEAGFGLLAIGGITAPLMDLILHYDAPDG